MRLMKEKKQKKNLVEHATTQPAAESNRMKADKMAEHAPSTSLTTKKKFQFKRLFGKTVEDRRNTVGLLFISPWIVGVILFFIIPMIAAVLYMFYNVSISDAGGAEYTFRGLDLIKEVLKNETNTQVIVNSFSSVILQGIIIVAFSFFIALILNQPFKGRGFVRAVFALPIIVSSGVLLMIFKQDLFASSMKNSSETATIFQSQNLQDSLAMIGLPPSFAEQVTSIVNQTMDLMWKAGVQILLFLAGLQSIPKHLYEVCKVEGSTPWQTFWKVTFPLMTPYLLLNVVYTIIDNFTFYDNQVMQLVTKYFNDLNYSYSTILAMFYCVFILVFVGIVGGLLSLKVKYTDK